MVQFNNRITYSLSAASVRPSPTKRTYPMRFAPLAAADEAPLAARAAEIAPLPEWNLADLYEGPDSPQVKADLERVSRDVAAFGEAYRGKLAGLAARVESSIARLI